MAQEIKYVKGDFRKYRANMRFSVGALGSQYVEKGDIVEYDGFTLRYNGEEVETHTLRGAIYAKWLSPVGEDTNFEYQPKAAGVQLHSTEAQGESRGEGFAVESVPNETREVGNIKSIRKTARHSENEGAKDLSPLAPTGAMEVDDDLRPVSNKMTVVHSDVGGTQGKVVRQVTSATKRQFDVSKISAEEVLGKAGDTTEDLFTSDEAALGITGLKATASQTQGVDTGTVAVSGDVSTGTEGRVVASLADRKAETTTESPAVEIPATEVSQESILKVKALMLRRVVPDVQWDMGLHWKTRVKNALTYKDSPSVLNAILAVETDAVRKHVLQSLEGNK